MVSSEVAERSTKQINMASLPELFSNIYVWCALALAFAYIFSVRIYPVIIYLSRVKNLMDVPGERSMHTNKTPTLGGIGLFITFSLGILMAGVLTDLDLESLHRILTLVAAVIILLFIGLKDDLLVISPRKKFMAQLLATGLVVVASDVRILSMDGIFGLGMLPYWVSVMFTVFVFILIINAFNLIDGIDGLAGGVAVLVCGFLGVFFAINNMDLMAIACFLLIGALIGFLGYNLSDRRKLFMGDSGSMFTGFLLAYFTVAFLNISASGNLEVPIANAPVMAIAVLSYPMIDTLRVFIVRMRQGRSPFVADSNHIHHRYLALGASHKMASLAIVTTNFVVMLLALLLQTTYIHFGLFCCVVIGTALYLIPFAWWHPKPIDDIPTIDNMPFLDPEKQPLSAKTTTSGTTRAIDFKASLRQRPPKDFGRVGALDSIVTNVSARDSKNSVVSQDTSMLRDVTGKHSKK